MTDRSSYQQNRFRGGSLRGEGRSPVERNLSVIIVQIAAPLRTLRAPFCALVLATRTGLPRKTAQNLILDPLPGKKEPHSDIPVGFSGSGWAKLSGEKSLDSRAFGGLWEGWFSAVFWQTERFRGVFSTRTEKRELSGFSGIGRSTG